MLVFHRGNGLPVLSGISVPKPVFQVIGSLRFKPSRDNSRIAGYLSRLIAVMKRGGSVPRKWRISCERETLVLVHSWCTLACKWDNCGATDSALSHSKQMKMVSTNRAGRFSKPPTENL